MNYLNYRKKELCYEDLPVSGLAKKYGTPLFVTSAKSIKARYLGFTKAFQDLDHIVCYAIKANFNLSILKLLAEMGSGADVGSRGELFRALKAGIPAKKIVFSGVGKTEEEIEYALRKKILMLKVESLSEMKQTEKIARRLKIVAPIAIRVNPRVATDTHAHISTGEVKHKFGVDEKLLPEAFRFARKSKHLNLIGIDLHIGSQIKKVNPFVRASRALLGYQKMAERFGHKITYLDLGGGFPASYRPNKHVKPIHKFAEALVPILQKSGAKILFEPGRCLVANTSLLVSKVLTIKKNEHGKIFTVLDAGMTELMRPALYAAYHHILPLKQDGRKIMKTNIVGPVCESTDVFAYGREIPEVREGEYVALLSAGAYGATMSNNYNARLRPAEVLVDGKKVKLIRRRETLEQLIQNEI